MTNRTAYVIAFAIIATVLIILVSSYNKAPNGIDGLTGKRASADDTPIDVEARRLDSCRLVLLVTHDFNARYCEGIQEDDTRLNGTYDAIQGLESEYVKSDICYNVYTIDENYDDKDTNYIYDICEQANIMP